MIYEFHNQFDVTLSEEYRMAASPGFGLLAYAAIAIIALIVLIARYRLNPFIVITLVSIGLALMAGMPADTIMGSYEAGVGKTLGHIALVVALGTMLGKMMAESGGAEQVARTLINRFGERNAHWAMVCIAFLVGLAAVFRGRFCVAGADRLYRGPACGRVDPDGRLADGRRSVGGACAGAAAPGGDDGGAGV